MEDWIEKKWIEGLQMKLSEYNKSRVFRAFYLSFKGALCSPGQILKSLYFPVFSALVVFSIMVIIISLVGFDTKGESFENRITSGNFAKVLKNKVSQWNSEERNKEDIIPIFVEPFDSHIPNQLSSSLLSEGFILSSDPTSQIRMRWWGDKWILETNQELVGVLLWPSVSKAVRTAYLSETLPPGFQTFTNKEKVSDKNHGRSVNEIRAFAANTILFAFIIPLSIAMFSLFPSTMAWVTNARGEGHLEQFALSPMPFSCYMLAYCLAQGIQYIFIFIGVIILAGLLLDWMDPVSLLFMAIGGGLLATAMSSLGFVAVFIFHHRTSTIVGLAIALPLVVVVAISWLSGVLKFGFLNAIDGMGFLQITPSVALSFLAIALPVSFVVTGVSCAFVEWRIGPWRTGLTRV